MQNDDHVTALRWFEEAEAAVHGGDDRRRFVRGRLHSTLVLAERRVVPMDWLDAVAEQEHSVVTDSKDADMVWRARLAGTLAFAKHTVLAAGEREDILDDIRDLVTTYAHVTMPDPHWRHELDSSAAMLAFLTTRGTEQHQALRDLETFAATLPDAEATSLLAPSLVQRAADSGDLAALQAAATLLRNDKANAAHRAIAAMIEAIGLFLADDFRSGIEALAEVRWLAAEVPELGFVTDALDGLADGWTVTDLHDLPRSRPEVAARIFQLSVARGEASSYRDAPELRRIAAAAARLIAFFPHNIADQRLWSSNWPARLRQRWPKSHRERRRAPSVARLLT